jgi:perosamine synthetase
MDLKKRFWFPMIGYNYRLTNLQAAIGLAQLERLDEKVDKHRQVAAWYREELASVPGLRLPAEKPWAKNVYWLFSVVLEGADEARRDAVMKSLADAGIETRPFFYPMHTLPMYSAAKADCPVATRLAAGGINLPTHGGVTRQDVGWVAEALREALK